MNLHSDKTQENKNKSVSAANSQIQLDGESTFQFVNNRPEAIAQRKLQELANNSIQAKQAANLQSVANNHPAQQQQSLGMSGQPALQRKRSVDSITDEEIRKTRPAAQRDVRNRQTMESDYNDSLASGIKLRDIGLKWYNGSDEYSNPAPIVNGFYNLGYKHDWSIDDDNRIVTVGSGRGKGAPNGEQLDMLDEDDYIYLNIIDTETGAITADNNWREGDNEANEATLGKAPPNSEMLWFHYEFALSKVGKQAPEGGPKQIKRSSISNQRTVDTILMCSAGANISLGGSYTFDDPFDDDTWAILGTPNANSAVWMLVQHGRGAGIADIEKITASKDSAESAMNLKIDYIDNDG